jgi:ketosteroid isomerase-like protein
MHEAAVRKLVAAFNAAWNAHDLDAALQMCTAEMVFEATGPAPDGRRLVGQAAVRAAWEPVFAGDGRFDIEEILVAGSRVIQRWRYDWGTGHVRGVDLITVQDGRIAEKLSYVKG